MAHEIDFSNGRANMAFRGNAPWHGLGFELRPDAPLEEWEEKAGFRWQVKKSPVVFTPEGGAGFVHVPKRWALYRSDTGAPLAVVSSMFNVTQPKQVLEFFRELIHLGGFKMETAGMLRGGAIYWALARYDDELSLPGKDSVKPYLLVATACDGSMSNMACFTATRAVCMNTVRMAIFDEKGQVRADVIRVPHSTKFDERRIKGELGLIGGSWDRFKRTAVAMTKRSVSDDEAFAFFMKVLYPDQPDADIHMTRPALEKLCDTYRHGVGQQVASANGTVWGVLNAVTRFVDHERQGSADTRLQAAWFGAGHRQKARAWALAEALATT